MSKNDNYNFNTYIDNWALIEFCKLKKINPDCLNATLVIFLSWLVKLQLTTNNVIYKDFENGRYILVNNDFIKQNVKFISTSKSMVHEHLKKLIKYSFVSVKNIEYNTRYVKVSPELIDLWNNKEYNTILSATEYLEKYKPNTLIGLKDKYSHIIITDWLTVLANFNLGYSEGKQPMKVNSITHALRLYLDKCLHNDLEGIHRNQRF